MSIDELVAEINNLPCWDMDLCAELCAHTGLSDEWNAADEENFEAVIYKAADILGVKIW